MATYIFNSAGELVFVNGSEAFVNITAAFDALGKANPDRLNGVEPGHTLAIVNFATYETRYVQVGLAFTAKM